jgi:hypothetical protein
LLEGYADALLARCRVHPFNSNDHYLLE